MIDLWDGRITDILPDIIADMPETAALAFTIRKQIEFITQKMAEAMIYAGINDLSEPALDILAIEFKTPFYDKNYAIERKREIIKDTLRLVSRTGTPAAVEEVVKNAMSEAVVKEWFDYDADPYHFKIDVLNTEEGMKNYDHVLQVIEAVKYYKNLRSFWDEIHFTAKPENLPKRYIGAAQESGLELTTSTDIIDPEDYLWLVDEIDVNMADECGVLCFDEGGTA